MPKSDVRTDNSGGVKLAHLNTERLLKQDNLAEKINPVQVVLYSVLLTKRKLQCKRL